MLTKYDQMIAGKKRPGFMLYRDVAYSMLRLPKREKSDLIDAIILYVFDGKIPKFESELLNFYWPTAAAALDRDNNKYAEKCINRTFAALKKNKKIPKGISLDEWIYTLKHTAADDQDSAQDSSADNNDDYIPPDDDDFPYDDISDDSDLPF